MSDGDQPVDPGDAAPPGDVDPTPADEAPALSELSGEPAQRDEPGAPAAGDSGQHEPHELSDSLPESSGSAARDLSELSVETLVTDLERVTAERDEYLDAYRRTQADFENFRKQSQRRLEDAVQRALGAFVERLLPVLDACDAAMSHGATEVEPILTALRHALEKEGLSRVAPEGEPFDPAVAEAVVHEPGEGGEHIVTEVLRAGYLWNGRVLRPAMVKVSD